MPVVPLDIHLQKIYNNTYCDWCLVRNEGGCIQQRVSIASIDSIGDSFPHSLRVAPVFARAALCTAAFGHEALARLRSLAREGVGSGRARLARAVWF